LSTQPKAIALLGLGKYGFITMHFDTPRTDVEAKTASLLEGIMVVSIDREWVSSYPFCAIRTDQLIDPKVIRNSTLFAREDLPDLEFYRSRLSRGAIHWQQDRNFSDPRLALK
jgi:hypothetical protein